MKIFVSHSLKDGTIISKIKSVLEPHGIKLLIAEHENNLTNTISEKIEGMIRSCDVGLVLLTKKGFNSKFVHQEIGFMHSLKKPRLSIVQLGLESKIVGFDFGRGYILFDPNEPEIALNKMKLALRRHWAKIQKVKRQKILEDEKQKKLFNQKMQQIQVQSQQIQEQQRLIQYIKEQSQKRIAEKIDFETKVGLGILALTLVSALTIAAVATAK